MTYPLEKQLMQQMTELGFKDALKCGGGCREPGFKMGLKIRLKN